MDPDTRLDRIEYYIRGGQRPDAESIAHEYLDSNRGSRADNDFTVAMLKLFKNFKCFSALASVAEHSLRAGATAPIIYTLYAQGLIDQGLIDAGIDLLTARKDGATTDRERSEFIGLLGRAYKQRFVNTIAQGGNADDDLRRAIGYYREVYALDPAWHGANLVALVNRAERDGISTDVAEASSDLATRVVADIGAKKKNLSFWEIASIAEASLALREWEVVVARYREFIRHPDTSAFGLGSAIRQLREIWKAIPGGEDPVSMILTQVEVKSLGYPDGGGEVTYTADDSRRVLQAFDRQADESLADEFGNLEAIHGDNKQVPAHVMRRLLEKENAICRVVNRNKFPHTPSGGTGFMVDPGELREAIPAGELDGWQRPVLVTNNHVLSEDGRSPSVRLRFANAVFDSLGATFRIEKILWQSPREELDISVAALEWDNALKSPDTIPLNLDSAPLADCSNSRSTEKIYVIGHPMGRGLEFSLADNLVVDHDFVTSSVPDPNYQRIHYGAPTEQGNSGSPVLDEYDFAVVGVHRAVARSPMRDRKDIDPYNANEAVAIRSVRVRM